MNWRSKKLTTMAIIFLVLPFVTLMTLQMKDATAESPTVVITEVTTTETYKIDVSVEITLAGFNYDFYTETLKLYINQSTATILANDYDGANSTITLSRPEEATFETNILSPVLTDGSHTDSAYYNVTVVAITNTDEKSSLVEWAEYIYMDTELPVITFISPSVALEEIWGIYTVETEITDNTNISTVEFYIDGVLRYTIDDPAYGQTTFTWDWLTSTNTRGQHTIRVKAIDATPAQNTEESAFTIEIVGPVLSYRHAVPTSIDFNDTLQLNITSSDSTNNLTSIDVHYALDGVWVNSTTTMNQEEYLLNFTLPEQPIGTNISWEFIVNNSAGQYHVFRGANERPYTILSVHWDDISPTADVTYDSQVVIGDDINIELNITEQTYIDSCVLSYQIDSGTWQEVNMTQTLMGTLTPELNTTWFMYVYNYTQDIEVFSQIHFYITMNDTASNTFQLGSESNFYTIRIIPDDLDAPILTWGQYPEKLTNNLNVTVTVRIEDNSSLQLVELFYTINGLQFSIEMIQLNATTWIGSFILEAGLGAEVQIWIQATDEYYNTGISEVKNFDVESSKTGVNHSNFVLWLILIALLIAPIAVTLLILKPQK